MKIKNLAFIIDKFKVFKNICSWSDTAPRCSILFAVFFARSNTQGF